MNQWQATSPCTPGSCVTHAQAPVGRAEAARRVGGVLSTIGAHFREGDPSASSRRLLRTLDVESVANTDRFSVDGPTGTLVVANHLSWLDIPAFLAVEPMTFLAKREVTNWPVIGAFAQRAGTVFIDRGALRPLPDCVARLAATLRSGRSVMVFPEATTWCSGGGPFRRAPFQAAIDAGAPVRPVTISYAQAGRPSTVAAFVGDDGLTTSIGRVTRASGLSVELIAHAALPPEGDRRELAALAERTVRMSERQREPAHV